MSQLPVSENSGKARTTPNHRHTFWLSGIGGFVLGALTVIVVLLLARQAGNRDEAGHKAGLPQQSVQENQTAQENEPPSGE